MNVQTPLRQGKGPRPLKLKADQFWHLKQAGAFAGYGKTELLEGEMSGVPLGADGEPDSDASVPIKLRVQDYLMLDEAGLLAGLGRTELIDGLLYEMSPQFRPHGMAKMELYDRLRDALRRLQSDLRPVIEISLALGDYSLREPDILLTNEPYGEGAVPAASVALAVEIAATTLPFDLGTKASLYAAAGIPECWIVDLSARRIHQMWAPQGEAYAERREVALGERIAAAMVEGLAVETAGI